MGLAVWVWAVRGGAAQATDPSTTGRPETVSAAERAFKLGVADEANFNFAGAMVHYRASVEVGPTSRWARSAHSRLAWLDARSDGDFGPLAALQRIRARPGMLQDPAALDALAIQAESFPPGLVRSEARVAVAANWLKRPERRLMARAELLKIMEDPSSAAVDARFAERDLVMSLLGDGLLDEAAAVIRQQPLDSSAAERVKELLRRRTLRRVGLAAGMAVITGLVGLAVRARLRRPQSPQEG
jgi:hypothetical protein